MGLLNRVITTFKKKPVSQADLVGKSTVTRRSLSVNLGIDFGTCYSKVCFSVGKDANFVKFPNSEYKDSVLFYDYDSKQLFYSKPNYNKNIDIIRYFKYSINDDNLPKSNYLGNLDYEIKPEILCCIFFLACLIKESKTYAIKHFSNISIDIRFDSLILGVPIDNYEDKNKNLYDIIFHIACKISDTVSKDSISIDALYELYKQNKNIEIPKFGISKINTLSELYAESLAFLKNRNTLNGVYAVVDIGGGTVDMAIIYKEGDDNYSMLSKTIKPLGIEIISNYIATKSIYVETLKNNLMNNNFTDLSFINIEKRDEMQEKLRSAFASIVIEAKNRNREALEDISNGDVRVILCGGGAYYKWYEAGIINNNIGMLRNQLPNKGLRLVKGKTDKLISETGINTHRLIIPYVLSQPIGQYINELNGFPWHFVKKTNLYKPTDSHERHYENIEKQKEIYGED